MNNCCLSMSFSFIIITAVLILLQCNSACGSDAATTVNKRCNEQELSVLMQIKAAFQTTENIYVREFDWEGTECCGWERVTCDRKSGRVIELDLSYGSNENDDEGCDREFGPSRNERLLNGTVFLAFGQLRSLSLAARRMAGFVPGSGLESWSSLRELKTLDLSDNDFSISTISSLPAVKSLHAIYLDNNNLEGNIPITELIPQNSSVVSLRGCGLSGSLPYLEAWSYLEMLSLEENDLNGTLTGLCQLKNLKELNLSRNSFTGNLPLCIGNLSSLQTLDLSYNQLQIKFPSSVFQSLVSLRCLSLSNNHLEGTLSLRTFINHTNLEVLGLSTTALNFRIEVMNLPFQLVNLELANCIVDTEATFLYNQHRLQVLDLSNTQSKGINPVMWLLQNNTNLTELDLHKNLFTGALQLPFFTHEKLSMLDLSDNSLSGEIPFDIITKLPTLYSLNLSINYFHGPLPIISTNNLLYLDLSINNITDDVNNLFPINAQFLPGIALDLSHNNLYGSFTNNLSIDASMLLLNDNDITGEIPVTICKCTFSVLDISNNDLFGTLPDCIGSASVEYGALKLSGNHLEGPLPLKICNLEWWLLDLSDNNISGTIPPCYDKSSLQVVNLSQNNLTGNFPETWLNISGIIAIDIQDNYLSGELIPIRIGKYSELAMLQARENMFVGHIPEQICQFKHLHILDLSYNNLSGDIPSCIIRMGINPFQDIQISDHGYQSEIRTVPLCVDKVINVTKNFGLKLMSKGRLDLYWDNILLAEQLIDLSSNNLLGNIPEEIGQMSWLITLNLSNNHLTGAIPNSISNLSGLESLDLSHNSLTGEIPRDMIKLTYLASFSVAYNNLSGPTLGNDSQFITFNSSSYEGNPNLCGPPLSESCFPTLDTFPSVSKDKRHEGTDFLILFGSFSLFFVISFWCFMAVLYFKRDWRYALFTLTDRYGDMMYVRVVLLVRKIGAARTERDN